MSELYAVLQRARGKDVKLVLKSGAELSGTLAAVVDGVAKLEGGASVESSEIAAVLETESAA